MKKKALVAAIAVLMSFTACGKTEDSGSSESKVESATETEAVTEAESVIETESATEAETLSEAAATDESSEADKSAGTENFTPVEGLSDNYADLENRSFAYNGKIFTLGKNTLQDLIDGGIPFKENDLNNSGNNVNKNHETASYNVDVNDWVHMQFDFLNTTDTNITEAECLLSSVRWYTNAVPLPKYDDSRNDLITENLDAATKIVGFAFPLTLTKEQLLANNSNPTEETKFNHVTYKIDSEVYMGSSGYDFEFNDDTNQLENVYITWLP